MEAEAGWTLEERQLGQIVMTAPGHKKNVVYVEGSPNFRVPQWYPFSLFRVWGLGFRV